MDYNFASALHDAARMRPDKDLVVAPDGSRHTYAAIEARAGAAAAVLAASGLGAGDRVGLRLPNSVDFIAYYFGLLSLGVTVLPSNTAAAARELAYVAGDVGMTALIALPDDAVAGEVGTRVLRLDELVAAEAQHTAVFAPVAVPAETTAVILYTSGSTGEPKGVELTHLNLLMVSVNEGFTTPTAEDDVVFAVLPFFHVYGLADLVNGPVVRRNTIVMCSKFSTKATLEIIQRERVTNLCGVPTMFHALVNADTSGYDLSSVRTTASGGAPMSPAQIDKIRATFPNADYVEGYGLTETGATGTYNGFPFEFRHGSVGRPMAGLQLKVLDAQDRPLGPGPENVGEICLRGLSIMKGYWRRPEVTAQALRDGWFRTGDLGWRDEDGYLYISGRSKDLIIRGGFNVYPQEVESVLEAHLSIVQAAVVGRPDEHYGEEVVAFVVCKDGSGDLDVEALTDYCRTQLAPYKVPRDVQVRLELPLGPTGKIDKRALAAELRSSGADLATSGSTASSN